MKQSQSFYYDLRRAAFRRGLRDGIPIGLGYLAVSFTLGIAAQKTGIPPLGGALMSFLMHASAGQFAALTVMAAGSGYLEMAFTELVVNLRYVLMSCSLSQKIDNRYSFGHRFLMGHYITDELFGIACACPGKVSPYYYYGAVVVASPGWILGTFAGAAVGNILPPIAVNALNISLYGMFLAAVIPPARKSRVIALLVLLSMLSSLLFSIIPGLKELSSGFQVIILTLLLAGIFAFVAPVREEAPHDD